MVVVLPLIGCWWSREEVGQDVFLSQDVMEDEVEILQSLHPSYLSPVKVLGIMEILKVVMICVDHHLMVPSHEVLLPSSKSMYYGK